MALDIDISDPSRKPRWHRKSPAHGFSPPPSARLPARLQELIGREHELALMEEMLGDGRALTVYEVNGNIVVSVTGTCSATRISN